MTIARFFLCTVQKVMNPFQKSQQSKLKGLIPKQKLDVTMDTLTHSLRALKKKNGSVKYVIFFWWKDILILPNNHKD